MTLHQGDREAHAACVLLGLDVALKLPGPLRRVKGKGRARPSRSALLALGRMAGLVALGACAGPTLQPATPAGAGAFVQEVAGLRVSVEAGAWSGQPRSLSDNVLPLLVVLGNTGNSPVTITRGDFVLLDDGNRQYLPLAPTEVVVLMGGGRTGGVAVAPSVGVGGSTGGGSFFALDLGVLLGGYGTDTRDIIPQALAEGPVLPGAEARGFVYFPRPTPGYKSLRLVVSPRDLPGQPRLDFEFRPAGQ